MAEIIENIEPNVKAKLETNAELNAESNLETTTESNTETQQPDNLLIYPVAASNTTDATPDTSADETTSTEALSTTEAISKTSSSDTERSPETSESENSTIENKDPEPSVNSTAEDKDPEPSANSTAEDKDPEPFANSTTEDKESKSSKSQEFESAPNSAATNTNTTTEDLDDDDYYDQTSSNTTKNEHPFRNFFSNFRSKRKMELNRDEMILSRISDDDLMEYLRLEQKRLEILQQAKDVREKRIWIAFQITITLLSVVLIVYFLKDNPVILVTILYTIGILVALRISKRPADSGNNKKTSDGSSKKPWD